MTGRERLNATLRHETTDRPPLDIGATAITGISAVALADLRDALGLEKRTVKIHEPFQLLGDVEEDMRQALGVDVVGIWNRNNMFGFENKNWKPWTMPSGLPVQVGGDFVLSEDTNGDYLIHPCGDKTAAPSGRLPKNGYYFDNITRTDGADPDESSGREDFAADYQVLTEEDLDFIGKQVETLYTQTEYGLVGNLGPLGLADSALIPGPGIKAPKGMRDIEEWLMGYYIHEDYIREVFDLHFEVAMENIKRYHSVVGERISAVTISGTDFGTQRSEFLSPDLFRSFFKPYYKKMNDWVHENTTWKTFYHSCGSIVRLLDDFVEMGVDILNPVQCSAEGMDAEMLKSKYGDKLTFWGGAVNTQQTLPFGTPEEVYAEASERLRVFAPNGGFVFNAVHNIQAGTPAANMMAFYKALQDYQK